MLNIQSEGSLPNSKSCKCLKESEVVSDLSKLSNSDLDPHGSRAKVDNEDVAAYYYIWHLG